MDPYQNLANAIIILAVKDYKVALTRLKKFPNDRLNVHEVEKLEEFFLSDWFQLLSDLDGEQLMLDVERMVLGKKVA